MSLYPENSDIPMLEPQSESIEFRTLIDQFEEEGAETRRRKWLYPKRIITVKYASISKANARTLWNFYINRGGRYETFNFFYPLTNTYTKEYVGTGDGSETIWNLPSNQAASYTLYLANQVMTGGGVEYTFTSQGGADGADKVEFTAAPNAGYVITFSFTGYLKVYGRFMEDIFDFETFYDRLINVGLKIQGLLNQ